MAKASKRALDDEEEVDYLDHDESDDEQRSEKILEKSRSIIGRLDALAREQARLKSTIEQRWVEDLRLYWGRYDEKTETELTAAKRSSAFVKLTRHKTNGWAARLADLLFPTDERNWGIKPTPLPELTRAQREAFEYAQKSLDDANRAEEMGNVEGGAILAEQAREYAQTANMTVEEINVARKACEMMEKTIDDQLTECRYQIQCRDVIEDGCRIGTGILKGPLTSQRLKRAWRNDDALAKALKSKGQDGGAWKLEAEPDPLPEFRRIDPWHFYPDMSARCIEDAEFTFERHLPTRRDLRRMALKLGFSRAAIRRLIEEGPPQTIEDVSYLADLRAMAGEGEAIKDRYVMWEYHGVLECDEIAILLRAAGDEQSAVEYEEEMDALDEHRVILYFCNNELLKIAPAYPLDSGDTLYSVWNFEKGETSIFGLGVPAVMGDSQKAVNAAWRMMLDNAALSVGPQIVVDKDQIEPQTKGDYGLKPLKFWLRSSTSNAAANPPFEVFNIPNNQQQLGGIVELGKAFIDEETSMPTIAQGEQGAASQTLGGMSILFNSANVVFRRVVKSFDDDLTTPTLRRAYDWNMQFNDDEAIKGDMQVDARGTSVLLVREIQSQNLLNIVTNWSVHQVLSPYIKVREAMAKALQTMMIVPDDVLHTEEEVEKLEQEAAANAPPPTPAPEELRIELQRIADETRRYVVDKQHEIELVKLAQSGEITLEEIRAKLQIKDKEIASKERQHAVNIAVEDRRATEAVAEGGTKVQARGQGVG